MTAVIQSSSASVGILQALSVTGAFTYGSVIPIIMGQNIGTCVTAMISAVGANKGAKRTAFVHLYFNVIGSIVFLIVYMAANAIFHFSFANETIGVAGIAAIHSIFNIFATLLLLPFTKGLEKLAYLTIPEDASENVKNDEEEEFKVLDSRFLSTPGFAIEQCVNVANQMAELTKDTLLSAIGLLKEYSQEIADKVEHGEVLIDKYDDKLSIYLTQLNSQNLTYRDSQVVSTLMHSINDFERISDHALNLMEIARKMNRKEIEFSSKAWEEMEVFQSAVEDIMECSVRAFVENDTELAQKVEPLEEVIDDINKQIKKRHVKRMRKGKCNVDTGLVFADIAANFERVSDHCSNLAVYMMQKEDGSLESHEYINMLTEENNEEFLQMQEAYREKYMLLKKD